MIALGKIAGTLVAGCLSLCLTQQAASAGAPATDMKKLAQLTGNWQGTGTYTWGKHSGTLKATWRCRSGAGAAAVVCDFEVSGIEGLPEVIREVDLFGYDGEKKQVTWDWVCSIGGSHRYSGTFSGDRLEVSDASSRTVLTLTARRITIAYAASEEGGITLDLAMTRTK